MGKEKRVHQSQMHLFVPFYIFCLENFVLLDIDEGKGGEKVGRMVIYIHIDIQGVGWKMTVGYSFLENRRCCFDVIK